MKTFLAFLMLAFMAMSFAPPTVERTSTDPVPVETVTELAAPLGAPLPAADKISFGFRKAVTLTSSTAINISPENLTLTFATLAIDTAAAINATVTNSIVGDRIILKATADASNRTIDFTGNMVAVDDSVLANKTKVFEFIYDGSKFIQLGEIQIN